MGTKRICIDVSSELAMADEIRIRLKCERLTVSVKMTIIRKCLKDIWGRNRRGEVSVETQRMH